MPQCFISSAVPAGNKVVVKMSSSSLVSSSGFGLRSSLGLSLGLSLGSLPIDFLSCFCGENVVGRPFEGIVTFPLAES